MHASNPETIYSAGSGGWTQARLITVSGSACTVPTSHTDKPMNQSIYQSLINSFIHSFTVASHSWHSGQNDVKAKI